MYNQNRTDRPSAPRTPWTTTLLIVIAAACVWLGPSRAPAAEPDAEAQPFRRRMTSMQALDHVLAQNLNSFGHRNWIIVADSAYPAQSRAAIETRYIGGRQIDAVKRVLEAVDSAKHVRGTIYVDGELRSVPDQDAPGINAYRKELQTLLGDRAVDDDTKHEALIGKLDEAAKTYRVLILKTDMTLPYTTVFIRLDCAYWTDAAEARLRAAVQ